MTKRTKKVGSAGRYSSRYGWKIRKKIAEIEKVQRDTHQCPNCRKEKMGRESFGVWKCSSCGEKTAGGAFRPTVHEFREKIEELSE